MRNDSWNGFLAYLKLNQFYDEASGLASGDRRAKLMHPAAVTKQEDI